MLARLKCVAIVVIAFGCSRAEKPAAFEAPNAPVILISIDTLRADHLPAYGYSHGSTPAIDALREDSILYRNAYSHVPLTLPSHVSMLTGQLPPDNGVRNNIGFPFDASKHETIPSLLKKNGYATGAAVSAYVLRGNTGLRGAFDFYDDDVAVREGEVVGRLQRPGKETVAVAERWISQQGAKPFFFMLHLFEPHTPYENGYDGDITMADNVVGTFIEFLKRSGIYDRALIILTSDHGEGLGDHGEDEHGIFLYREDIHVPLIVKLPKSAMAKTTVDAPAQLIDIFPTVIGVTGAKGEAAKGHSLLDIASLPPRRIYSETLYPRIHLGWSDLRSLVDDDFHYIDAPTPELYATSDTTERSNIVSENRRVLAEMRKTLEPFSREMPVTGNIDPEEAKKLAALGYLSSTSATTSGPLPDPKDRIDELTMMKEAARLKSEGHAEEAVATYRDILSRNPRLTDAWTMLGRQLESMGRYEEAVETYKRGIQVAPSVAGEFSLALAAVYLVMNKPAEAASHAELGLQTNPGSANILIGRAALARGDLDGAVRYANEAMKSPSYRPSAMVLSAQVLVRQRRLDDALALLQQAESDARTRGLDIPALLYYVRGDTLARLNRPDEAIPAFNEEIRLYPQDRQAYASLAVVHILLGQRSEAQTTMERLVKANPSRSSYELAARTFAEMRDQASAAAWNRRAASAR